MVFVLTFLLPASVLLADFNDAVTRADDLHDQGKFAEAKALLLDATAQSQDGKEQAELYWRISRENIQLGDIADKAKKPSRKARGMRTRPLLRTPARTWAISGNRRTSGDGDR